MANIPESLLRLKTEIMIEDPPVIQTNRPYFGISGIGNECPRALWYSFRWTTERAFSPRVQRLLTRGHREEPIIIADLKKIGIKVSGRQKTIIAGEGHIKGHCDGVAENVPDAPNTPHLLEFKTANDANFKKIVKQGVQKAKPEYYAQCQCYMDKLKLKRALFIVVNKNTDARYYERIRIDKKAAQFYFDRAMDIISTETPPDKIGGATWFSCKWCDHYSVCHFDEPIQENCRTCRFLDIYPRGRWRCSRRKEPRSVKRQREGCVLWEKMDSLKT
jgi:hypothetical protein